MNLAMNLIPQLGFELKKKKNSDKPKCCRACGETQLIQVGPEYLCSVCDWDSTFESVAAGKMDHLFKAYKEQFRK